MDSTLYYMTFVHTNQAFTLVHQFAILPVGVDTELVPM